MRTLLLLLAAAAVLPTSVLDAQTAPAAGTAAGTAAAGAPAARGFSAAELARMRGRAARVTITRDDWGIAHVRGRTDADAVFGMIYAQAEDDFNRVETNYLDALGRRAEAEGEQAIWQDLRQKLFVHPDSMRAKYRASPAWLRALMDAWADGLNFYLATHPRTAPRVITRFEPWMPLAFSEGSIGGDIESISLEHLAAFYGDSAARPAPARAGARTAEAVEREPSGSNGIAVAPKNTTAGRALLLINPHTSFFFRSELQMTSDEGLNAYGAATWGQFFVYQGFNPRVGWMHTTAVSDAIDEYAETVVERAGRLFYRHGAALRPVRVRRVTVPYRTAGGMAERTFTVYRTHHGPVVRSAEGKWVSVALMEKPVEALSQSFLRTKARNLAEFRRALAFEANSSNGTVYADADGSIAYWHPQFIPRRDTTFDWSKPVDGSDPRTDWRGVHGLAGSPAAVNPSVGWVQNTNNWPYSAAGPDSPKRADFPRYMDVYGENPRGVNALRLLRARKDFSLQALMETAYDPWLSAFADLVPALVAAWDSLPAGDSLRTRTAEQVAALRGWDFRWAASSVPTSLAVYWGEELERRTRNSADSEILSVYEAMAKRTPAAVKVGALLAASEKLAADFGTWRTPWGEINRFQRLTGDIVQPFSDSAPSIPVPFASAKWGSLASFGARAYPGTKRRYGTGGNSFVAVVEFGRDSVRARAVTAGGESGDPRSKHFNDQAERYAAGNLREVYFYPSQLAGHTERTYRPGELQTAER